MTLLGVPPKIKLTHHQGAILIDTGGILCLSIIHAQPIFQQHFAIFVTSGHHDFVARSKTSPCSAKHPDLLCNSMDVHKLRWPRN